MPNSLNKAVLTVYNCAPPLMQIEPIEDRIFLGIFVVFLAPPAFSERPFFIQAAGGTIRLAHFQKDCLPALRFREIQKLSQQTRAHAMTPNRASNGNVFDLPFHTDCSSDDESLNPSLALLVFFLLAFLRLRFLFLVFLLNDQSYSRRTRGPKQRLILLEGPMDRGDSVLLQSQHGRKIGRSGGANGKFHVFSFSWQPGAHG